MTKFLINTGIYHILSSNSNAHSFTGAYRKTTLIVHIKRIFLGCDKYA